MSLSGCTRYHPYVYHYIYIFIVNLFIYMYIICRGKSFEDLKQLQALLTVSGFEDHRVVWP